MANRPQQGGGVDREGTNREQKTNNGFRSVQLLKVQTLGIGAYGSVCKAICDDLPCAAKILHPTLFDPTAHQQIAHHREHRLPIRRFEQECEFMSAIKHSNIVQYLGTCQDPETRLPVLLMELMDDSLTHFLESSQNPVPYHIQVNFCHDITLAISYLHLNSITHRDLSSNNVLLYGNVKAKVTDFGMAKLGDINPQATHLTFTTCPGTDAYMPPEAVRDQTAYTTKIDCFAIGTLIIQILTRKFPKPGNRHKTVNTTDPRFPTIEMRVSEIERRQNHITEVDPNHPLLPIALDCLKDSDVERPSAQELCHRVAALKGTSQYTESAQEKQDNTTEREDQITELQQQIQEKDDIIREKADDIQKKVDIIREKDHVIQQRTQQIQGLQQNIGSQNNRLQEKDREIRDKDQVIEENTHTIEAKERQIRQVTQQLETSEQVTAQFQTRIQELEQQLNTEVKAKPRSSLTDPPQTYHSDNGVAALAEALPPIPKPRTKIPREPNFPEENAHTIEAKERQLRQVTQQLETSEQVTAQFQTRIHELEQQLNKEVKAKPQPSLSDPPRMHHSDTSSRAVTRDSIQLRWRKAKKAPREIYRVSDAIVNSNIVYHRASGTQHIYGYNATEDTWDSTLPDCPTDYCSLALVNNLLTTIGGYSGGKKTNQLFSLTGEGSSRRWREEFQPMPTKRTHTAAVCSGQALIVAGGWNQDYKRLRTVEVMDIATKQWSTAADLPGPLFGASVTVCGDRIYTLGGWSDKYTPTKSVYTCTLISLFQSCHYRSLGARLAGSLLLTAQARPTAVWEEVADLPVTLSTCVTLHGRIHAIGGTKDDDTPTSDIRMYHPSSNTWEVISKMTTSRCACFAAVLPNNQLMVVGGYTTQYGSETDSVEIASIV